MKRQAVMPWALLALSVVLGVVSFVILPETVVTQFSLGGSEVTTMPKPLAVLLPFALCAGGALAFMFGKGDEKGRGKCLIVSLAGLVVFALMLFANR